MIQRLQFKSIVGATGTPHSNPPNEMGSITVPLSSMVRPNAMTPGILMTNFTGWDVPTATIPMTQYTGSDGGTLGSPRVDLSPITATFRLYGNGQASRQRLQNVFIAGGRVAMLAMESATAGSPFYTRTAVVSSVDVQRFSNAVEAVVTLYPEKTYWYPGTSDTVAAVGSVQGGTSYRINSSFVLGNDVPMAPSMAIYTDTALTALVISGPGGASWRLPFSTAGLGGSYNNTLPAGYVLSVNMNRDRYAIGARNTTSVTYSQSSTWVKNFPPPSTSFVLPPGTHSFTITATPSTAKLSLQWYREPRYRVL